MKIIKWGIIGLGKVAHKFAEDLMVVEQAELVAVASRTLHKAKEFASKFNVGEAYGSYEEMVEESQLDVIYIATPHSEQTFCTLLCLAKGIGVLCEKPFALDSTEVVKMISQSKESNSFLMEAMWTRFMPGIVKTKELIDSGAIGQVTIIEADFGFIATFDPANRIFNRSLGGGALMDIGIYPVFLALFVLGYPNEILVSTSLGSTQVDETTAIIYQYGDYARAVLHCTFRAHTRTEAFVYGTEGYIHIKSRFHQPKQIVYCKNNGIPEVFSFDRKTHGYEYEIREVNKCIQSGKKESQIWPLENSLQLIKLLDQTREAAGISYH